MDAQVVYEDKNIVALNKPAGVNFDWALETRPELIPAHRLDKDTSGIILFAKNQETAEYLKSLFQDHKIKKTYLTLVVGNLKNNSGVIDLAIGRSKKTPLKRVAIGEQRGKIREAVTEYKVIKQCDSPAGGFALIEAYPKTGRTHQIRSHFAAIGHPIVCDKLYAGKKFICPAGLKRQFLHAFAIEFNLPPLAPLLVKEGKGEVGSRLRLEADLPNDLENVKVLLCHH